MILAAILNLMRINRNVVILNQRRHSPHAMKYSPRVPVTGPGTAGDYGNPLH
jgi:hypothetical protein